MPTRYCTITGDHSKWDLHGIRSTQKKLYISLLLLTNNIRSYQVFTMVPRNNGIILKKEKHVIIFVYFIFSISALSQQPPSVP